MVLQTSKINPNGITMAIFFEITKIAQRSGALSSEPPSFWQLGLYPKPGPGCEMQKNSSFGFKKCLAKFWLLA